MLEILTSFVSSVLANLVPSFLIKKDKDLRIDNRDMKGGGDTEAKVTFGKINQTTNNTTHIHDSITRTTYTFRDMETSSIKEVARILFVDDQNQIRTIRNLNKLGWQHASQLRMEDILNSDSEGYRNADLVFVDFDNIGSTKNGQGLSILSSLVARYGRKKAYILHTAHPKKITLEKLEESGLPIRDNLEWSQLTKGSADYLVETTMLNRLKQIER